MEYRGTTEMKIKRMQGCGNLYSVKQKLKHKLRGYVNIFMKWTLATIPSSREITCYRVTKHSDTSVPHLQDVIANANATFYLWYQQMCSHSTVNVNSFTLRIPINIANYHN